MAAAVSTFPGVGVLVTTTYLGEIGSEGAGPTLKISTGLAPRLSGP
jgi:hypothetical protein